jgi:hypothetical protein
MLIFRCVANGNLGLGRGSNDDGSTPYQELFKFVVGEDEDEDEVSTEALAPGSAIPESDATRSSPQKFEGWAGPLEVSENTPTFLGCIFRQPTLSKRHK